MAGANHRGDPFFPNLPIGFARRERADPALFRKTQNGLD